MPAHSQQSLIAHIDICNQHTHKLNPSLIIMADFAKTNNLLLVTLRGNGLDSNVVTLISRPVSDRGFHSDTRTASRYVKYRKRYDTNNQNIDLPSEGCNLICKQDKPVEFQFRNVVQHLSKLTHYIDNRTTPYPLVDQCYAARIETILAIYSKLLSLGPLEFHLIPKNGGSDIDLLELRVKILQFIENLDGYCNSIGLLRFILKSPTMVGAMFAHRNIKRLLKTRQDQGCIQYERPSLID